MKFLSKIQALRPNDAIYYHNVCKLNYYNKHRTSRIFHKSDWHVTREIHDSVNNEIYSFITESTIINKNCYSLEYLVEYAKNALHKLFSEKYDIYESTLTRNYLLEKLKKKFGGDLQIETYHHKKIIAPRERSVITDETFSEFEESEVLERAAFILRRKILSITTPPVPSTVKASDLISEESEIPAHVSQFLRSLICSNDPRTCESCNCTSKVNSIAQDLIYAASREKIKTSKHVTLGLTLKSITNSREVIDIINKYGHCCSYNTIEKIENEATFSKGMNLCASIIQFIYF